MRVYLKTEDETIYTDLPWGISEIQNLIHHRSQRNGILLEWHTISILGLSRELDHRYPSTGTHCTCCHHDAPTITDEKIAHIEPRYITNIEPPEGY